MRPEAPRGSLAVGFAVGGLIGLLALELDLATLVSYWESRAPLAVVVALACALLWRTRLKALLVLVAAGLSALWLAVAFTPLCARLADGLVRRDQVEPADAVFVFGSSLQLDGDPMPEAMSRLLHALELLSEGQAPRLVLSELPSPKASYAPVARTLMRRLHLEREVIGVGPVTNTRDEAVAVGALVRQQGWKRLLAVTSPAHTRRACAALEREGVAVLSSPAVETRFDLERLERPDDRLRAFGTILHERVGLWVYGRRGWISH